MNKKLIFGLFALLVASFVFGLNSASAYHYDNGYGYQPYGYQYSSSYSKETNCGYYGCTTEVSKDNPYSSTYYRTTNNYYPRYYPAPHYQYYRINPGYGSYGYVHYPQVRYSYSPYYNTAYRYWSYGY